MLKVVRILNEIGLTTKKKEKEEILSRNRRESASARCISFTISVSKRI
ncbi:MULTISPECIES: hypothetical protein [Bacillus cereus group]|nr:MULTISPECIES: hypothetical protein [Bacillus cereus group]